MFRSQNSTIDRTIDRRWPRLIVRSIVFGYHESYDFQRYDGSCHRSSPIVVDRATTRTTNRTMTYHQQKRPIAVDRFWRLQQTLPIGRTFAKSQPIYDQEIVRSGVTVALRVHPIVKFHCTLMDPSWLFSSSTWALVVKGSHSIG